MRLDIYQTETARIASEQSTGLTTERRFADQTGGKGPQ